MDNQPAPLGTITLGLCVIKYSSDIGLLQEHFERLSLLLVVVPYWQIFFLWSIPDLTEQTAHHFFLFSRACLRIIIVCCMCQGAVCVESRAHRPKQNYSAETQAAKSFFKLAAMFCCLDGEHLRPSVLLHQLLASSDPRQSALEQQKAIVALPSLSQA